MRDPTGGGLATTLNEILNTQKYGIVIEKQAIPVNDGIRALCEILGDDQLPRISYLYVKDMLKNGRIIYESSCLRYIRRKEKRGDNAF
ncbi:MAG: hydrogenase expression/formation protein HypE [Planctomycetota bacterium]|nr:hydrogenase expression/formation protein HypE [Planctomycetota bacterium]